MNPAQAPLGFRHATTGMVGLRAVGAGSAHSFPRHTHEEYGIGVIISGGQISASGRGQVSAGAGDVITVNPAEVHDGLPLGDRPRHWRMIYLAPGLMTDLACGIDPLAEGDVEFNAPVFTRPKRAMSLLAGLDRLLSAAPRDPDDSALSTETWLLRVLAPFLHHRRRPESTVDLAHPGLARAKALLDDDGDAADLSLARLANEAGLSRFQLLRAFAARHGLPPHAYLMQRRADAARRSIEFGATLAEAALRAGYADQSHMTRDFRRRYGLSPSAFRNAP